MLSIILIIFFNSSSLFFIKQSSASNGIIITVDNGWYTIENEFYRVRFHSGQGYGGYVQDAYALLENGSWSPDLSYSGYNYGWHVPEWESTAYFLPGGWSQVDVTIDYQSSDLVILRAKYEKEWKVNFTYAFFAGKPYYYVAIDHSYKTDASISNTQTFWTISPQLISDCYILDYATGQVKNVGSGTYYMAETLSQNTTSCVPFWASYSQTYNITIASIMLNFDDELEKTVSVKLSKNCAYPNQNTEWQFSYWDAADYDERKPNSNIIRRAEILQYIYAGNITQVLNDAHQLKSKQFSDSVPSNVFSIASWKGYKIARYGLNAWSPFLSLGAYSPRQINGYASFQGILTPFLNWEAYAKNSTWNIELNPNLNPSLASEIESSTYGKAYVKWVRDEIVWWENATQYVDSDKIVFNASAALNESKVLTQIYLNLIKTSNVEISQISTNIFDVRMVDPLIGWFGIAINVSKGTCSFIEDNLKIFALNGTEQQYPQGSNWIIEVIFWSHMGNLTSPEQFSGLHERENLRFNDVWIDPSRSGGYFGFDGYIKDNLNILVLADGLCIIDDDYAIFPIFVKTIDNLEIYSALKPSSIQWKGNSINFDYDNSTKKLITTLSPEGFGYLVIQFNNRNGPGMCPTNLPVNQTWASSLRMLNLSFINTKNETIKIFCGSFGEPSEIQGGILLNYNANTMEAIIYPEKNIVVLIFISSASPSYYIWGGIMGAGGLFVYILYKKWRKKT